MRSPLRYIGSKNIDLTEYGINNYDTYCEPFGGGFNTGIVLLDSGYTGKVVYNDLDEEVVNFWECLKEDSDRLFDYIVDDGEDNKFKRAAKEFEYRRQLHLNGKLGSNKDVASFLRYDLYLTSLLLKDVEINNNYYSSVMHKINDEKTFLLVDPPYNVKNVGKYYRCNSNEFNHEALFDELKNFKGKWLLTYNDCEDIRELYKEFNVEKKVRTLYSRNYVELYITNH